MNYWKLIVQLSFSLSFKLLFFFKNSFADCIKGFLTCVQDSRRMEKMLQALCFDSRAGSYFTHFCEQSGNQVLQ